MEKMIRQLAPDIDTSGGQSDLEHCCTQNCRTSLCPKQVLRDKFSESESLEDQMKVLKEIQEDEKMLPIDKPKVLRETFMRLQQKAKTIEECKTILAQIPETANFELTRELLLNKMKSLEAAG
jgi:hypothetical protein